jgi:hypothetical protein
VNAECKTGVTVLKINPRLEKTMHYKDSLPFSLKTIASLKCLPHPHPLLPKVCVTSNRQKRPATARFGVPTHLDTSRCKFAGLV